MAKKYVCKFCNRGVCYKCSPLREFNNLLKSDARICMKCHNKAIESQVTAVYNDEMLDYV
jgi:hypothetical protein